MKKLLLLFAAMCSTMMMHAEIVHHAACEPTYPTVGYAQECWEDTGTGKLYSEAGCINELHPARVVTYKKLRRNPITSNNSFEESVNRCGADFYWNAFGDVSNYSNALRESNSTIEFKVYGENVANARIKMCRKVNNYFLGYYKIYIRDNCIYNIEEQYELSNDNILEEVYVYPLPNLQHDDVVKIEMYSRGGEHTSQFFASLEYTSINGGDPDVLGIKAHDKRKIKGADDPELTYYVHYPSSSTEGLTDISISRTPGEEPGFYPIHVSFAEPANPDCEIINYDGILEIVDGVYHVKGEPYSNRGLVYKQNCWEAKGKYYADDYLEHELTSYEAIGYPKLPSNPITAKDGFTIKESSIYDGIPFDWAAETTFEKGESGMRTVEFSVTEPNMYNNARLVWYISTGAGYAAGHLDYAIYKNGVVVESYSQPLNADFTRGLRSVPLPDLKIGDKIKFEFNWRGGSNIPIVAACLQYIYPQDLYLRAEEAGSTVELKRNGATESVKIQYSTDYSNWTTVDFSSVTTTGTITLANVGDRVYFRKADEGVASEFSTADNQFSFAMTGKIAASGNVMSLIDNTCEATTIPNEYCFAKLFEGCTSLTSAPKLPATTLKGTCYWCMFLGCTNLTTPPVLPATTLAESCYTFLFSGCTKLATAPVLPATTLKAWCYNSMFENCTSLTTAPVLPVTTLAEACYVRMFKDCTSLASAPELPATTMATQCYSGMFNGCTKLVSAPTLASASLAPTCYRGMFEGCTSLTAAPALPATELKAYCYQNMFSGCTNLKSAPTLSAMKMLDYCYSNMFKDCTSLTTAPALPATTLALNCYMGMFSGCKKLESAPELPAMNMLAGCYEEMFKGCTSLTTAPELPATVLTRGCYTEMFNGCTKLNHVKVAFTEWTYSSVFIPENWLNGVASTGIFVCPDALDKSKSGASYIPEGWTPVFEAKANKDPESENYYSTFYSGTNAYEVPSGVIAYTGVVEESTSNPDESVLKLTAISDGIIPADEPVILKAAQSQVYLPYTTETASKNEDNELVGTDEAKTLGTNDYALSLGQHGVGFYLWNGKTIGANKAYLTLDEALGVKSLIFRFDDETTTTGINFVNEDEDENLYNLNGLRVGKDYKGIVIKNGKKVIR